LKELKKDVWRVLIDRMELRRILSVKRNEELNRQIETGKDLPDIDEAQILAMLEGTLANTCAFIEEAVQEVFEFLRRWRAGPIERKLSQAALPHWHTDNCLLLTTAKFGANR
jgi:hypothetical protein